MLSLGEIAPLFVATSTQGVVKLEEYIGQKHVVLIFYPKDHTPVCTKQLCAAQDSSMQFDEVDAVVFGVNPASVEDHEGFARRFGYEFGLIHDAGEEIRKKYKVGKILGLFAQERVVYIINKAGRIVYARKGNPSTEELLTVIRQQS
ncbi:MAG: peroxiredoxin [Clostridia bacterium]